MILQWGLVNDNWISLGILIVEILKKILLQLFLVGTWSIELVPFSDLLCLLHNPHRVLMSWLPVCTQGFLLLAWFVIFPCDSKCHAKDELIYLASFHPVMLPPSHCLSWNRRRKNYVNHHLPGPLVIKMALSFPCSFHHSFCLLVRLNRMKFTDGIRVIIFNVSPWPSSPYLLHWTTEKTPTLVEIMFSPEAACK